jgi:hypothetical protein
VRWFVSQSKPLRASISHQSSASRRNTNATRRKEPTMRPLVQPRRESLLPSHRVFSLSTIARCENCMSNSANIFWTCPIKLNWRLYASISSWISRITTSRMHKK